MRSALQKVAGVSSVQVNLTDGEAVVQVEKGKVTGAQLIEAIDKGHGMHEYKATLVKDDSKPEAEKPAAKEDKTQGRKRPSKKPNVR